MLHTRKKHRGSNMVGKIGHHGTNRHGTGLLPRLHHRGDDHVVSKKGKISLRPFPPISSRRPPKGVHRERGVCLFCGSYRLVLNLGSISPSFAVRTHFVLLPKLPHSRHRENRNRHYAQVVSRMRFTHCCTNTESTACVSEALPYLWFERCSKKPHPSFASQIVQRTHIPLLPCMPAHESTPRTK